MEQSCRLIDTMIVKYIRATVFKERRGQNSCVNLGVSFALSSLLFVVLANLMLKIAYFNACVSFLLIPSCGIEGILFVV